jgi:agmatine deiminase
MPAEWELHKRCWMGWPRRLSWTDSAEDFDALCKAQERLVRAIARYEPVALVLSPLDAPDARVRFVGAPIELIELPADDIWLRDTGPLFVRSTDGLGATLLQFNAWGGKNDTHAEDAKLAARIAHHAGVIPDPLPLIAEGGALEVDGRGTLLTTRTAILNVNRNPGLSAREAAELLKRGLGVSHVVWLPGSDVDVITDGHIDGIAKFVRPGVVLAEIARDPQHPEHRVLAENLRALELARDAHGRPFEIVTVSRPTEVRSDTPYFCDSYINAYLANGAVIMPAFGDCPADEAAQAIFARCWPERSVVPLDVDAICEGGGGIHCVTQQQPR